MERNDLNLEDYGKVISKDENRVELRVARDDITEIASRILTELPVKDLTIEEAPIEEAIEQIFEEKEAIK